MKQFLFFVVLVLIASSTFAHETSTPKPCNCSTSNTVVQVHHDDRHRTRDMFIGAGLGAGVVGVVWYYEKKKDAVKFTSSAYAAER